jgi:hypothetical protein
MENPCYKCGQPVEEGIPFCLHCSAPQIRVVIAQPAPSLNASPDAIAVSPHSSDVPVPPALGGAVFSMRWSQAIQPCALAALVATLLMFLGLYFLVAMVSAGFLAVIFYRQRRPGAVVKAQAGAKLGALSGILWFGIASILYAVLVAVLHKGAELRSEMLTKIQQAASQTADPQTLAMFNRLKTPEGLEFLMVFGLICAFLAAIILAGVGGALGGAILGRNDKT